MNRNILNDLLNTRGHVSEEELNAYLNGNATADAQHKVENSMLDNPLFSEAVEGYQEMGLSAIPALESFSDFKKKLPAPEGAKVIHLSPMQRVIRGVAVAAAILLGVFAYNAFQSTSPDSLYADFYTHYENDISLTRRGAADGLNKDFKNALWQYMAGEFNASLPGFEKALQAEPENSAAHFFAGLASMEINQFDNSLEHLNVVKKSNSTYARKAAWYAILATLKAGDIESAKLMLKEYTKAPGFKSSEAKALMKELT